MQGAPTELGSELELGVRRWGGWMIERGHTVLVP